jgi:hypothetical protein
LPPQRNRAAISPKFNLLNSLVIEIPLYAASFLVREDVAEVPEKNEWLKSN